MGSPYNLPASSSRSCPTSQAKQIPSSLPPRLPNILSLLHSFSRTSRYHHRQHHSEMGSSPPPPYIEKSTGGTRPTSYHNDSQLLPPGSTSTSNHTRERSSSRVFDALKGIFTTSSDKGSKEPMNRSRSLVTAVDVSMTVNIIASPGAMSTLQAPSPGRPEVPGSVYSSRNPSPSHGNFHSHFRTITDDQLHALKGFDTQFLIDDSGSMKLQSSTAVAKGRTHWEEVKLVLLDIVKVCAEFDENGVDVFFFNSSLVGQFNRTNIKEPKEVMELFEARSQAGIRGSTPTAEALDLIISPYLQECERSRVENRGFPKPKNVIILTDGAANNNKLLKQNLISYARRLDTIDAPPDQIGVQFFQVGNVEGVDDFLTHLDNALSEENECRDFIDTRSSEEMGPEGLTAKGVLTTVLGGVIRSNSIVTPSTTEYDLASRNGPRKQSPKPRDGEKNTKGKSCDNNIKIRGRKSREQDGKSLEGRRERSKSGSQR